MISFIIPAYNEERFLGRTLPALEVAARALGEPYEVIVVDDASSDGTVRVAEAHGARVVAVAHRQISVTRNAGAGAAQGEFLVFVDADTLVNASLVGAAVRAMRDGAVGGGARIQVDGRPARWVRIFSAAILRILAWGGIAGGCFLFCTREAFQAAGGFDGSLFAAEEIALSRALARQGRFVILREFVTTSGRKFHSYSARQVMELLGRLAIHGPRLLRRRQGLEFWYEGRREESKGAA